MRRRASCQRRPIQAVFIGVANNVYNEPIGDGLGVCNASGRGDVQAALVASPNNFLAPAAIPVSDLFSATYCNSSAAAPPSSIVRFNHVTLSLHKSSSYAIKLLH